MFVDSSVSLDLYDGFNFGISFSVFRPATGAGVVQCDPGRVSTRSVHLHSSGLHGISVVALCQDLTNVSWGLGPLQTKATYCLFRWQDTQHCKAFRRQSEEQLRPFWLHSLQRNQPQWLEPALRHSCNPAETQCSTEPPATPLPDTPATPATQATSHAPASYTSHTGPHQPHLSLSFEPGLHAFLVRLDQRHNSSMGQVLSGRAYCP